MQQISDEDFKKEVEEFDGVVLVDFWAEWCMPCRMLGPIVEEVAGEYKDNTKVKIVKLNIDENQQTAQRFGIMSIPTMMLFKKGDTVDTLVGLKQKPDIKAAIDKAL